MMTCCRLDPAPKLDAAAMSSVVTDVVAVCYTSVFDSVTNTTKSVYTGENTEYFGLERVRTFPVSLNFFQSDFNSKCDSSLFSTSGRTLVLHLDFL
jgi:hypothetical protein